jgi:hypothetical protein
MLSVSPPRFYGVAERLPNSAFQQHPDASRTPCMSNIAHINHVLLQFGTVRHHISLPRAASHAMDGVDSVLVNAHMLGPKQSKGPNISYISIKDCRI